jgi:hypothetical protein
MLDGLGLATFMAESRVRGFDLPQKDVEGNVAGPELREDAGCTAWEADEVITGFSAGHGGVDLGYLREARRRLPYGRPSIVGIGFALSS